MTPRRKRPRLLPGSPLDWLKHAQSDCQLARLAKGRQGILPEQICFHAQQAVEKAIKAVLVFRRIAFPLVHDVEELLELTRQGGISVPPSVAEAGSLTPFAVQARYPGYDEAISSEEVEEAIRLAEHAIAWASSMIKRQR